MTPESKNSSPAAAPSLQEVKKFILDAGNGDVDGVNAFIDAYPGHLDLTDDCSDTALTWTIGRKKHAMARLLLERGAGVNAANKKDKTPLQCAVEWRDTEMARLLLEQGADPDLRNFAPWTPLMLAAHQGLTETARLLLEHGADAEAADSVGNTALSLAQEEHPATAAVIEGWITARQAREDLERAEARAKAREAACLEKLKQNRPEKPPFGRKGPQGSP